MGEGGHFIVSSLQVALYFPILPYISELALYFPKFSLYVLYWQQFHKIDRLNPKETTKILCIPWVCWPPNPRLLHRQESYF